LTQQKVKSRSKTVDVSDEFLKKCVMFMLASMKIKTPWYLRPSWWIQLTF